MEVQYHLPVMMSTTAVIQLMVKVDKLVYLLEYSLEHMLDYYLSGSPRERY